MFCVLDVLYSGRFVKWTFGNLDVLLPGHSVTERLVNGRFVTGRFETGRSVTGRFVGVSSILIADDLQLLCGIV
jgi:hypothetical protein